MTTTQQGTPQVIGVGHVALSRGTGRARPVLSDVLGLEVVPTETSDLGENVFLSSRPAEVSVELALLLTPPSSTPLSKSVRWRTSAPFISGSSAEACK